MNNQSFNATLRNNKGFTLIEMAIVLVIIGIILAAVMKGQDLIEGAKSKQFASTIQSWQLALQTHYDRKGRYPGDTDKDGVIGKTTDYAAAFADISASRLVSPPPKKFQLGGATFYVVAGNDNAASPKNYLLVCKATHCNTAFSPTDAADLAALKFFETYDTSVDGSADATKGTVTGATAVTATADSYKATALTIGAGNTDWIQATDIKALAIHLK